MFSLNPDMSLDESRNIARLFRLMAGESVMQWWAEFFTIVAGIAAVIAVVPLMPLFFLWGRRAWIGMWLAVSRASPIQFTFIKKEIMRDSNSDLVGLGVEIHLSSKDGYDRKIRKFYPLVLVPFAVPRVSKLEEVDSMEVDGSNHDLEASTRMFKPFTVTREVTEIGLRSSYQPIDVSVNLTTAFKISIEYIVDGRSYKHEWDLDYTPNP